MTFSSLAFLFIFFPIVFLLYFVCANNTARNIILIIASLIFYAYGEPVAVVIMLLSIICNYFFGLMCANVIGRGNASKKAGLIAAIVLNIGLLFVYKYSTFFLSSIGLSAYAFNIALPIGISFFTFQGLSYVIDVYRDKNCVQKNIFSVMLYISFFPQLIAGPIVKYHDIREQLNKREFNISRISNGLMRFSFGLGKKVLIAGPMGLMADSIYALSPSSLGKLSAWIAGISYMLQIYFDFSGYSDMAIGLGCIFGFDFKENFRKPYTASSMQDFWRKWHISLSTWFKEYVYIPLGGNRKGQFRTYANKFIVFTLTGLWHGANYTFICWGIMHAIALITEDLIKRLVNNIFHTLTAPVKYILSFFKHIYALIFIMITFMVFRADSLLHAAGMIIRLFAGSGSNTIAFSLLTSDYLIALALAIVFSSALPDIIMPKLPIWLLRLLSVLTYIVSISMLISGGYNPFIYFRF